MKKLLKVLLIYALFCFSLNAETVISVPLDSRPISYEYLKNLASIQGDNVINISKNNLDKMNGTSYVKGNTTQIQLELDQLIKQCPENDPTVILNCSSYFNGGLVASRNGDTYNNYAQDFKKLKQTISAHPKAHYYINLTIPRTLPEDRSNIIWSNNEKLDGLMSFYLKNPDITDAEVLRFLNNHYSKVSPTQFLMEWSYVTNKAIRAPWEEEFLNYSTTLIQDTNPEFLTSYENSFKATYEIAKLLLTLDQSNVEIIISNDDLQLPNSIFHLYKSAKCSWVDGEKYSFAKTYCDAIKNEILSKYGSEVLDQALHGQNERINFIYGADEVPQLIYARSLSKRQNVASKFNVFSNSSNIIGRYDVQSADNIVQTDINFINAGKNTLDKDNLIYLFDYNNLQDKDQYLQNIKYDLQNDSMNTLLIELLKEDSIHCELLDHLIRSKNCNIYDLAAYSSWNTIGNAIGLGLAHMQVYNIATNVHMPSHYQMLSQHLIEDGYFRAIKKQAAELNINPLAASNQSLAHAFDSNLLSKSLKEKKMALTINEYSFPWQRAFDCYLDISIDPK